jgi:hypothetical protein
MIKSLAANVTLEDQRSISVTAKRGRGDKPHELTMMDGPLTRYYSLPSRVRLRLRASIALMFELHRNRGRLALASSPPKLVAASGPKSSSAPQSKACAASSSFANLGGGMGGCRNEGSAAMRDGWG